MTVRHADGSRFSPHEMRARQMVNASRLRAQARGLPHDIDWQDVIAVWPADNRCPVFGIPFGPPRLGTDRQGPRMDSPSLDRIRAADGYVRGNIAIISWRANKMKSAWPTEDLERLLAWQRKQEIW